MPLCESCNSRPAKVKLTVLIGGEKKTYHVCEVCADELSLGIHHKTAEPQGIQEALSKLTPPVLPQGKKEKAPKRKGHPRQVVLKCPMCGMTWEEFRKHFRVGCAYCYVAFGDALKRSIQEYHGTVVYRGKKYATDEASRKLLRKRRALLEELEAAVQQEEFERAAQLRDEIARLEEELGWRSPNS